MKFQKIMYQQKSEVKASPVFWKIVYPNLTQEENKQQKNLKPFATDGFEPIVAKLFVSSAGYLTHPEEKAESQDTQRYNYTFEGRNVKVTK